MSDELNEAAALVREATETILQYRRALEMVVDAGKPHGRSRWNEDCGCECCDAWHNAKFVLGETDE